MNDRILDPVAILIVLGVLVFSGPTVRFLKRTRLTILDALTLLVLIIVAFVIWMPK